MLSEVIELCIALRAALTLTVIAFCLFSLIVQSDICHFLITRTNKSMNWKVNLSEYFASKRITKAVKHSSRAHMN